MIRTLIVFLFFLSPSLIYARVLNGIDVLQKDNFKILKGANVALITNHTGVNRRGVSTVDLLHKAKKVHLKAILTPEHGFRGAAGHGEEVGDSVDPKTKVPIYSLYGKSTRPTDEMLTGVDTLVFDIQDIGTRFYTYITTMGQAYEEASKRGIRFVVLDRPNPVRGDIIEGDVLDADVRRFTGYYSIPVRHGLTVGELIRWMKKDRNIKGSLFVVPMKNWERHMWFTQTGLKFLPPSPNIPNLTAALLYPGIGSFEATNVSVGRGTDTPFEIFGAPWINGKALCIRLREANLPGVLFDPITFQPSKDYYAGKRCRGVRMTVTDRKTVRPFDIFLISFLFLQETYPQEFQPIWEEVRVVTGSHRLKEAVERQISLSTLMAQYDKTVADFKNRIASFYLYK